MSLPQPERIPEPAEIPPVEILPEPGPKEKAELDDIEGDGRKLDHSLRTWAGYGALLFAFALYVAGLLAIALFLGLFPCWPRVQADMWHIVVATLVALFTVPTFLVMAVLRSSGAARKDADADNLHAAIGEKAMKVLDKLIGGDK